MNTSLHFTRVGVQESQMPTPEPYPDPHVIQRMQEHAAHTERTVDELSGEITELNERMRQLADRLVSVERRFMKLIEDAPEKLGS